VLVAPSDFRAGPWACRSLARAGYRVIGAHHEGRMAGGRSLACPRPRRYPSPLDDPDGFVEALGDIVRRERVAAILPTSEDVVRVLADREPDLGGALVVGPTADQYRRLCDKGSLAAAAARAGVAHPATVVVGPDGPDGPMPPLPCVVKPRISGEETHGVAVAVTALTALERDRAVDALRVQGRDALVQELLDGPRWFAHSVGLGDDFRLVAFEALADYPRRSGPASFLRTADAPRELRDATLRLMDLVGYAGPCSLSFIESGGRLLVHDVNLRLGATVGASIRGGFDVPRRAVDIALGRTSPPERTAARAITYVRLDGELGALADRLARRAAPEPVWPLVGRIARGAASPGWMLDPSPLDPYLAGTLAGRRLLGLARAARRRIRPRAGAGGPAEPAETAGAATEDRRVASPRT
jgi:predicted ATP-grasp superfamily ATP-dependent carboligase